MSPEWRFLRDIGLWVLVIVAFVGLFEASQRATSWLEHRQIPVVDSGAKR